MIIKKTIVVKNPFGLHLRSAAELINKLSGFKSEVVVRKGKESVNARSIIDLMTLEAGIGTRLEFIIEGIDADSAVDAIFSFFENDSKTEDPVYPETVFS
jgi:phosphotransferase system HPr (HPr) family protein